MLNIKKRHKRELRNKVKILSCKLHEFDCNRAIERECAKQKRNNIDMPIYPIAVRCRCKNCGGTMSLLYAMPYMEALKHTQQKG